MELKDVSLADAMILCQNNVINSKELKEYMEVKALYIRTQIANAKSNNSISEEDPEKGNILK